MRINLILMMIVFLIGSNCTTGYNTRPGYIFESYGMNKDVSSMTDLGTKEGKACTSNFLGWFAVGEAGIKEASANGGIKKVKAVDFSRINFLGLYANLCTIARGD